MPPRIPECTTATLESTVSKPCPSLITFGTDWCAPCKRLEKVLLEMHEEGEGTLQIGKVNIEDEPDLAASFSIARSPTLLIFFSGRLVTRHEGFVDKLRITAIMSETLPEVSRPSP